MPRVTKVQEDEDGIGLLNHHHRVEVTVVATPPPPPPPLPASGLRPE